MKKALFLAIFALLAACTEKKENTAPQEKPAPYEVELAGLLDFGRIKVGEAGHSAVKITNNTDRDLFYFPSISGPELSAAGTRGGCDPQRVFARSVCHLLLEYRPADGLRKSATLEILGKSFVFSGKGLELGRLEIEPASWSAGELEAGESATKKFVFKNSGDENLAFPSVAPPYQRELGFFSSGCPEVIEPGKSCEVVMRLRREQAGLFSEQIELESGQARFPFAVSASVRPASAYGLIKVEQHPGKLLADGQDSGLAVFEVRDQFGNPVADGTAVAVEAKNLLINESVYHTLQGLVEIEVTSTTERSEAGLSLVSGDAVGSLAMEHLSGPPAGEITFEPFNPRVPADGQGQVVVKTRSVTDEFGNPVDNGRELNFSYSYLRQVEGQEGIFETASVQGSARVVDAVAYIGLPAPVVAQSVQVEVFYEEEGQIGASGSFSVEFVATRPAGDFAASSEEPSVFYKFQSPENSGEAADRTRVCFGPVTDVNGNVAAEGTIVPVEIENGSTLDNRFFAEILTGPDGKACLEVKGVGIRGPIKIRAGQYDIQEGEPEKTVTHTVWALAPQYFTHDKFQPDRFELFSANVASNTDFDAASAPAPDSGVWRKFQGDLEKLEKIDTDILGSRKFSAAPHMLEGKHYNFSSPTCLHAVEEFYLAASCSTTTEMTGLPRFGSSRPFLINPSGRGRFVRLIDNTDLLGDLSLIEGEQLPNHHLVGMNHFFNRESNSIVTLGLLRFGDQGIGEDFSGTLLYRGAMHANNSMDTLSPLPERFLDNPRHLFSQTVEIEGQSWIFGGLFTDWNGAITVGSQFHRLRKDSESNGLVQSQMAFEDLSGKLQPDRLWGKPSSRLLSALYYDEDAKRAHVIGGYVWNADLRKFEASREIWSLAQEDGESGGEQWRWKKECAECPGVPVHQETLDKLTQLRDIAGSGVLPPSLLWFFFDLNRDLRTPMVMDYGSAQDPVVYYSGGDRIYRYHPQNPSMSELSQEHPLASMIPAKQLLYHPGLNEHVALVNNLEEPDTDSARVWRYGSAPGQKPVFMARFSLPEGGEFAKEMAVVSNAWAKAQSSRAGEELHSHGLKTRIYNHSEKAWELVEENFFENDYQAAQNDQGTRLEASKLASYISANREVFVLLEPSGATGRHFQEGVSDGYTDLKINHLAIKGVW